MKQSLLIITIILFSLIWWGIGAYWVFKYLPSSSPISNHSSALLDNEENEIQWSPENISEKQVDLISLENMITQTVKEIAPSVVSIVIKKDLVIYRSDPWGFFQQPTGTISRQVWGWSGFFIREDGTIITNKHVVQDQNAEYTVILSSWEEFDATVLALDPINDLAVIKLQTDRSDFPVLSVLEESGDVQIWQFSIAVWNALAEFQNSVSLWIISGKWRTIEAGWDTLSGLLQTDAAINPWNSGWPLINTSWEAIGINTAIASGSMGIWFAFALTQDRIDYMLKSIRESGRIKRPFIGINYIDNSPWVARELWLAVNEWVYIINEPESIVSWSSAETSWLEPWDIILEVNGAPISWKELGIIIQNSLPWDSLSLKVLKKSWESETLSLKLWEY